MTEREEYREKWQQLQGLIQEKHGWVTDENTPLKVEYRAALLAAFKAKYPKKKVPSELPPRELERWLHDKLSVEACSEISAPFRARAGQMLEDNDAQQKILKTRMDELLEKFNPLPGDLEVQVGDYWASTYRSTNSGARYAEGLAALKVEVAKRYGIEARIVTKRGDYADSERFEVIAKVHEEMDGAILQKLNLPLRDWMKFILGRVLNPRVYNPFLPWGLEERLGLDAWGWDIPKKR